MTYEPVYITALATPGLLKTCGLVINDEAVYRTATATPGLLKNHPEEGHF